MSGDLQLWEMWKENFEDTIPNEHQDVLKGLKPTEDALLKEFEYYNRDLAKAIRRKRIHGSPAYQHLQNAYSRGDNPIQRDDGRSIYKELDTFFMVADKDYAFTSWGKLAISTSINAFIHDFRKTLLLLSAAGCTKSEFEQRHKLIDILMGFAVTSGVPESLSLYITNLETISQTDPDCQALTAD